MTRFTILVALFLGLGWTIQPNPEPDLPPEFTSETPVADALAALGETPQPHHLEELDPELVRMGEELTKIGRTKGPDGKMTRYISKYFSCTSCHNLVQEDPDISIMDPDARLDYAVKNQIPFLQGTTFRGMTDRESWYNDDYIIKYGSENIARANKNLREAIKLCAIECSQGRPLADWETEAILAYSQSLQWKLGDLALSEEDWDRLKNPPESSEERKKLAKRIKTYYSQTSPATFGYPRQFITPTGPGDPEKGEAVYELSCRHCHKEYGVSDYLLDYSPVTFRQLRKNMEKDNLFSLYVIVRRGTHAHPGARPYMPHYPHEKMSDQQIEDLRAYIEVMAE